LASEQAVTPRKLIIVNDSQFIKATKWTQLVTCKYYICRSDMFRHSKHDLQEARDAKFETNCQ
jgi:hypothetical protein